MRRTRRVPISRQARLPLQPGTMPRLLYDWVRWCDLWGLRDVGVTIARRKPLRRLRLRPGVAVTAEPRRDASVRTVQLAAVEAAEALGSSSPCDPRRE